MNFLFKDLKPVYFNYPSNILSFANSKVSFSTGMQCNIYNFFSGVKDTSFNNFNTLAISRQCNFIDNISKKDSIETTFDVYLAHINNESFFLKTVNNKYIESSFNNKSKFTFIKSGDFNEDSYYVLVDGLYITVNEKRSIILKNVNLISNLAKENYNFKLRFIDDNKCTIQLLLSPYTYLTINKKILTCNSVFLPFTNYDNSHVFKYTKINNSTLSVDIANSNKWVSYYMSLSDRSNNENLEILNTMNAPAEYLLSFNIHEAFSGSCKLDVMTLKTNFFNNNAGQNIPINYKENKTIENTNNTSSKLMFGTDKGEYSL
jgi:hypothetical protein